MLVGYKLINDNSGEVVQQWGGAWGECPGIPNPLVLPDGTQVCAADIEQSYNGYTLEKWVLDESARPKRKVFDGADFLDRFGDDEYVAVTASNDVHVRRWLDAFRLRGEIDVSSEAAQNAKARLVSLGLISQARSDVIFAEE